MLEHKSVYSIIGLLKQKVDEKSLNELTDSLEQEGLTAYQPMMGGDGGVVHETVIILLSIDEPLRSIVAGILAIRINKLISRIVKWYKQRPELVNDKSSNYVAHIFIYRRKLFGGKSTFDIKVPLDKPLSKTELKNLIKKAND